jgi:4-hydroxy-2-oxoheptanedioate aldolase
MKSIIEKAKKNGITIGTFTDSDETVKMWLESGVQYISYSVDVGIFYESCRHLVHKFHTIYK